MMIRERYGRDKSNFKKYPSTCLEGMRKTTEINP
jgi:hypothetical protein